MIEGFLFRNYTSKKDITKVSNILKYNHNLSIVRLYTFEQIANFIFPCNKKSFLRFVDIDLRFPSLTQRFINRIMLRA